MTDNFPAPVAANLLTKDKVYVVWYNNNEEYDENFVDVEAIFSTKEKAEQYIIDKGYTRKATVKWYDPAGIKESFRYFLPNDEKCIWDPSLEIREFELNRTDNTDYNEEGTGV